jgi:hypothetical protein
MTREDGLGVAVCHSSAGGLGVTAWGMVCGATCHGALADDGVERATGSPSLRLPRMAGAARTTSALGGE